MEVTPDKKVLYDMIHVRMPFGKFEGRRLCDLPLFYLAWFKRREWPSGRIGFLMENVYEIKINGMEPFLFELRDHLTNTY